MRKKCENKAENKKKCPCAETECVRHGICCECINYHREEGRRPACMR